MGYRVSRRNLLNWRCMKFWIFHYLNLAAVLESPLLYGAVYFNWGDNGVSTLVFHQGALRKFLSRQLVRDIGNQLDLIRKCLIDITGFCKSLNYRVICYMFSISCIEKKKKSIIVVYLICLHYHFSICQTNNTLWLFRSIDFEFSTQLFHLHYNIVLFLPVLYIFIL